MGISRDNQELLTGGFRVYGCRLNGTRGGQSKGSVHGGLESDYVQD